MSDKEENPHPNWRALASVSFHRKVFVKANEETSEKAKKNQQVQKRQLQGTEAKAFYQSVLDSEPEVKKFFEQLSYTHKKEYVQWIEGAKKQETRERRMLKSIEMMKSGKKGV